MAKKTYRELMEKANQSRIATNDTKHETDAAAPVTKVKRTR